MSVPLTPGSGGTSTAVVTFATIDPGTLQTGTHGMEAIYQPSGNFSNSVGGLLQQVNPDGTTGTTTTLVSSQSPSETGQSVTFTATVTAVSGSTAPTGTVSFFDSVAGLLSTVNLGTGSGLTAQAMLTTSALTGSATGTLHNIAAVYNPSGSFATSTSTNLAQTVRNGIPTTVTVSGSPNPSAVNQSVTVTGTVAAAAGFTGTPTGTVDLSVIINGTNHVVGSGVALSNGTASATAPGTLFPTAGTFIVQAIYHATGNFQDQTVGQSSEIITSGTATTATLTSSPNPSFVNGAVSFTATIKTANGTPTGNVNFVDNSNGGNSIGMVTLSAVTGAAAATLSNVTSLAAGTHNIEAIYAGDGTFAASTASVTQTVNAPVATTTTVTSSVNPSIVDQSVTFTATVSAQSGTATPTGSVTFTIDGTASAPIKLSGGVATMSTSALTVAGSPHSVSAAYTSADGSFTASTGSLNPGQTVNKNTSTTTVTSSLNPAATGASVTFTATVSGSGGGGVPPSGTVTFVDITTGTTLGGGPITLQPGSTSSVTSVSTSFVGTGTHNIVATYNGDVNFSGGSGTFAEMINAGTTTTTTVTSSAQPSVFGQPVTFTATVSGGGGTPTGTVTFTIDGVAGSPVTLSGGSATSPAISTLTVAGSPHIVTAAYSGDGTFAGSTSANFSQTVNPANTSTTVASSQNPSAAGQSVTFTATVSANSPSTAVPTGSVVFTIDGTAGSPITLSGGVATTSTSTLTVAGSPHTVFATYTPNPGNFTGSNSAILSQNVVNGSSTTTVASSVSPSTSGQTVVFTATITGTGSATAPTGMVTFKDNGTVIGTGAVGTIGGVSTATLSIVLTTSGNHPITATYSGDTNFAGSTSAILNQGVSKGATTTTLTASPNPATPGQQVTFTATVTIKSGTGTLTPGTVTFNEGLTVLGTASINNAGVATFTTSALTSGSHSITATYSGNTSFSGSTSVAFTEQIGAPTDSIKLCQMQISTTPVIAAAWGATTASAMDDAVSAGFGGNPASLSPAGTGFTYYFNDDAPAQPKDASDQDSLRRYLASPNGSLSSPNGNPAATDAKSAAANDSVKRVDDDFKALGYAGGMPTKAPPPPSSTPHDWLAWVTVRGTDYFRGTFGDDLKGNQVDALAGLTRRVSKDFVIGAFGGYEHFDYSSQAFNAVLKGDGWTAGAYLGWKLAPNLRFDAGAAWSDIFANDTAGTAIGNFTGTRWLINGGLTGTYPWQQFVFEPSARVFAVWEHENAFTDSLGTLQAARNFETGRASVGAKAIYPFAWTSSTVALSPYAGLYADYYFSKDDAQTAGLTTVPLLQGFSARATGGVAASFANGATLGAGGEFGGIGSATHIWTWTARGRIPF